jgi:extracellular factor (EF) 3-hydroxypalmitic acid methyl ester biosynthesis protein
MKQLMQQANALYEDLNNTDHTSAKQVQHFLQHFTNTVLTWEKEHSRAEIIDVLGNIRAIAAGSPFIERAQRWPRGYPGDFETIDYMLAAENKVAATSGFAYYIEDFFLQSDICEQHRNKVARQAALVQETLDKNPTAKIISIGCGTSEDLFRSLSQIELSPCQITLVDIDEQALHYSKRRLESISSKLEIIHGNIYKVIRRLTSRYDLILVGGVFDYLKDNVIAVILKELVNRMKKEGTLFFTNIASGNPYRISMEYLSDWILIERNENDIARIMQSAAVTHSYTMERDATGLTYMVTIRW